MDILNNKFKIEDVKITDIHKNYETGYERIVMTHEPTGLSIECSRKNGINHKNKLRLMGILKTMVRNHDKS